MTLPDSGLHDGIPETEYHADPRSLSSTGAKTLLYQGPRAYRWAQDHPVHKDAFDLGSVVHALILGVGDYEVLPFDSWRTKESKESKEEARAAGRTPILAKDYAEAEAMRDAVMENRLAASILAGGRPEVSGWATDPDSGVLMRGRFDYLRDEAIVDVKTSAKPVHPAEFQWTVRNFHYGLQAAWYRRIHRLNTGADLPYLWVAVSTTAPHECYVMQADAALLDDGDFDVDRALRRYADCLATGEWPGLADAHEIHTITDPRKGTA